MKHGNKLILLSLVACIALADQRISTAVTSPVTSNTSENITITTTGSITVDQDLALNISYLNAGNSVINEGNITSKEGGTVYFYDDLYGTFSNESTGIIDSNETAVCIAQTNQGTISNSGIIKSSTGNGIYVKNSDTGSYYNTGNTGSKGSIVNNGDITAKVSGISIVENKGNVTNSGTIQSINLDGIRLNFYNGGNIVNSGTIVSADGSGINITRGDNNGSVLNEGNITAGNGIGISVEQNNYKTVKNTGDINASVGINVGTNSNNANVFNGYYNENGNIDSNLSSILVNENDGYVENFGKLNSKNADGIEIDGNNTGYVSNNSFISALNGSGIEVKGINFNSIENYTDIKANTGINVAANAINGVVLNFGNIDSNQSSISVNDNDGNITNQGTLTSTDGRGIEVTGTNSNLIQNSGDINASIGIHVGVNSIGGVVLNTAEGNISSIIVDENNGTVTNQGTVNNPYADAINIMRNNGTVLNDKNATIASSARMVISINENQSGSYIINKGQLTGENVIEIYDNNGTVLNDTAGKITSNGTGLIIDNDNYKNIINNGYILSSDSGIKVDFYNIGAVENNGSISANNGIFVGNNFDTGTVLNAQTGEINSSDTAIDIGGNNKGNITNNGIINANGSGIVIGTNKETGAVINNGTVNSQIYGISVNENNGTILNDVKGTVTSQKYSAVSVNTNNADIINKGTLVNVSIDNGIEVSANNGLILNDTDANITADNISISVDDNNGTVKNMGTLTGYTGMNAVENQSGGKIINALNGNIYAKHYGIEAENNFGNVTNSGMINSSDGWGIFINGINSGDVLNDAGAEIDANLSSIYINGANNKNIINKGELTSLNGSGIELQAGNLGSIINDTGAVINSNLSSVYTAVNEGNITNRGITVSKYYNGIDIDGNNTGIILNDTDGNITALNGSGIYIGGSEAGTVINNGTVTGDYSLQAESAVAGIFTNNGIVAGSIDAGGMDVVNSGEIDLGAKEYIKANTFTQNASGVLNVGMEVNSTTLSAETSKVYAYKNIVFKDGSTININIYNTSGDTIGKWFDTLSNSKISGYKDFNNSEGIIAKSEEGNITADINKLNFTDNSALLVFSAENNGTVMSLIVKKSANLEQLATSAGDVYAAGAAKALDEIFSSSNINGDIDRFLTNLDSQSIDTQKAQSIAEITPAGVLSASTAALQASGAVSGAIGARQRGANSGDSLFKDRNLWIKPYYTYTTQSDKDGYKGFSSHTRGFVIGADGEYGDSKRAGLAFAYGRSNVDTNGLPQSNDIDSYTLIAYGSNPVIDSDIMMSYQAGFGIQRVDSSRYISTTNQTATASYNAKLFYAQAVMNRNMELKDRLIFVPRLKMAYKYYHNPGYSESGAGGLDLNVRSYNTEEFIIGAGGALNYTMGMGTTLRAYANVDYNTINDRQTVSASFQGANDVVFQTGGIKNSAATFNGGMSVDKKLQHNTSFSFGFNIDRKTSRFTSRNVFAKYNMKF